MYFPNIIKRSVISKCLVLTTLAVLAASLSLSASACKSTGLPQPKSVLLQDDFGAGTLDLSRWAITRDGDFAENAVDVTNVNPSGQTDYRLRMLANTIGTADDTVKFLGARALPEIDLTRPVSISFDLDWNNQANGSYLTAGVFLCPVVTSANPEETPDWFAFEYWGVPPGQNARFQVSENLSGQLHLLFTEGWPDQQREGRKIGVQHLNIVIDSGTISVVENGKEIYHTTDTMPGFTRAYLYLQMSSHSNYPSRTVYFDNVLVKNTPN